MIAYNLYKIYNNNNHMDYQVYLRLWFNETGLSNQILHSFVYNNSSVRAVHHRCNHNFSDNLRVHVGQSAQPSIVFVEELIAELLSSVFGCHLVAIPLFQPVSEHTTNIDVSWRRKMTMRPLLGALERWYVGRGNNQSK